MERRFETPERAARDDIPEQFARTLAVSISPDGTEAIVLLGTNEPPDLYPYQSDIRRDVDGWLSGGGSNMQIQGTLWDEAPPDANVAIVEYERTEYEVPVVNGYFHFSPWDFGKDLGGVPKLQRFSH
jgi:hypothetical protein